MMSFDIGVYDLAAQIDYVLEKTKQKQVSLVGHSQGTTAGLVLLSERPEYNDKVAVFHAMTPPAIMRHFNKLFLPLITHRELVMVIKICFSSLGLHLHHHRIY